MIDNFYAVIMAGGGGTRLWPLSRQARPKQMLQLFGDKTLFQIAVERLEGLLPPEQVYVVTVQDQAQALQAQCPQIPRENYLLEPLPRGTASVVGLAAVTLAEKDPEAVMAVLTADHFIKDVALFQELLRAARIAAGEDLLVTLGIHPTYPATGYGYLRMGAQKGVFGGMPAHDTESFIEKPDLATAQTMVADGRHAWNSGMFVWRTDRILGEFESQMPALFQALQEIGRRLNSPDSQAVIQRVWPTLRVETIDYGVMEGAEGVVTFSAEGLGWSDVGSWESLYELLPADEDGNIFMRGDHLSLATRDTLLYNDQDQRLVVTIGIEGLVVVDTGDVLLICDKAQSQKVRAAVEKLNLSGKEQVL